MAQFRYRLLCLTFCYIVDFALSQQLQNAPLSEPSWPNITMKCFEVMNTTVSCPAFLHRISVDQQRLSQGELDTLCTSTCRNTLRGVRSNIVNACKGPTDIIEYFDGINYPATFVVDQYLQAYDVACRKDPTTGQFCDPLVSSWLSNTNWTKEMDCHDCILGTMQTQLKSPLDYTEEYADDFASLTSSCGSSQYAVTIPASYALSTRTQDTLVPTSTCTTAYAVKSGDTCNSISEANQVSTYGITYLNGLYSDCSNLSWKSSICIPVKCTTYKVSINDTCDSIIEQSGRAISGPQFLAWNPNVNVLCSNMGDLVDKYICLSPPGGFQRAPTPTEGGAPISKPTAPVARPTNTFPESNGNCGHWYNITEGDNCEKVSIKNSISLQDFYFLNPEINNNTCANLILGVAYCVMPIGEITTYPNYPKTTNFITVTSNTFTTAVSTPPPSIPAPTPVQSTPLPHAPGTQDGCFAYKNYREVSPIVDQSESFESGIFTDYVNSCGYLANTYRTTIDDLVKWNPSLDENNCTMKAGFSYCVKDSESYKRPDDGRRLSYCSWTVEEKKVPEGTASTCSCFAEIQGDEWPNDAETCDGIIDGIHLDASNIPIWNPWVGSDCDTGLYAGLAAGDTRFVCIGVSGTQRARFPSIGNTTNTTTT